ncbi:MAG: hypothetical protein JWR87_3761 [Segetibacter sp.]|jgi:hypothetical protein|nr:hypothetical protein [Segetibacter sp.]
MIHKYIITFQLPKFLKKSRKINRFLNFSYQTKALFIEINLIVTAIEWLFNIVVSHPATIFSLMIFPRYFPLKKTICSTGFAAFIAAHQIKVQECDARKAT